MKIKYKKINPNSENYKCYQLGDEPEVIHVIKMGKKGLYCVVHDDAYDLFTGKSELMLSGQILEKYGVDVKA